MKSVESLWLPPIFEFSDGKLRICFPLVSPERTGKIEPPASFATKDKPLVVNSSKKLDESLLDWVDRLFAL
ncbi:MAG: hypothetical protein IT427_01800 [Pirellulales bacterium]|nr:hypothetical protein [Pirellulales bacterium]